VLDKVTGAEINRVFSTNPDGILVREPIVAVLMQVRAGPQSAPSLARDGDLVPANSVRASPFTGGVVKGGVVTLPWRVWVARVGR